MPLRRKGIRYNAVSPLRRQRRSRLRSPPPPAPLRRAPARHTPTPQTIQTPLAQPQQPSAENGETPAGAYYFRASELDQRAQLQAEPDITWPDGSEMQDGYLVAQILISERGAVDAVHVMVSEPEGVFDESIQRAFERARFQPGIKNGVPVKSEMVIEFRVAPSLADPSENPLRVLTPPVPSSASNPSTPPEAQSIDRVE